MQMIINSFIFSNFNHCPLVLQFCSNKASNKTELSRKRCLGTIFNDNVTNYKTILE